MSKRNNDRSGRLRNQIVAFRMSPEEASLLDSLVTMSGLTKQDYIISRLLDRTVTVTPSVRVQKGLHDQMLAILESLQEIENASQMTLDIQEAIATLAHIFVGLSGQTPTANSDPLLSANLLLPNQQKGEPDE